ncbi:protein ECT2 isoform X1 [Drosophila guanche]|uniref:Blast:Protein ECT2 n=1 Tax=Drosophila guanche TaxID=7266 RepID=A0A3B0KMA9_DROGU|nr:protein ECT2 isoform X1 [Drosophila guanche]SPP86966.1 blast:Protein ECT2 [Drosophila guanche]
METIEEQSKCEMTITTLPTRICLVGNAGQDAGTLLAAESFGLPVITSDTGQDIADDKEWRTFYVMEDFEGDSFQALHKQKECILGPPALKYAAEMKQTLGHNSRPIYNYAMRGVVTCFTGIRQKDELTKLVHHIHSMGGCIKRDMNPKTTHLICSHSGGAKYQYAKTFRLSVVRPDWVYAAWADRDTLEFDATQESFTKTHRLKAFEGQKVCFFGFPADEHQHMVDVLLENGGVCASLEDPECSHVVMPNTGVVLTSTSTSTDTNPITSKITCSGSLTNPDPQPTTVGGSSSPPQTPTSSRDSGRAGGAAEGGEPMEEAEPLEGVEAQALEEKENECDNRADYEDEDIHFDERLFVETAPIQMAGEDQLPESDDDEDNQGASEDVQASTPKTSKQRISLAAATPISSSPETNTEAMAMEMGLKLQSHTPNVSPILKAIDECDMETDDLFDEEAVEGTDPSAPVTENDLKRKRDSVDNISLMSVDSCVLPGSTKKPKLTRTGSISRTLRRSVSFVAEPLKNVLRPRRSSIAAADVSTILDSEAADDSFCSLASSISLTLNESIRKPVKDKFRNICSRITRSSSRRGDKDRDRHGDREGTPECSSLGPPMDSGFKTPKAPKPRSSATPKTSKRLFGPVSSVVSSLALSNVPSPSPQPPSHPSWDTNDTSTTSTFALCAAAAAAAAVVPTSSSSSSSTVTAAAVEHSSVQDIKEESPNGSTQRPEPMQMVVDEHTTVAKPDPKNIQSHILKSDWFWYTIQNGYANEMDYLFGDYLYSLTNTPNTDRRDSLPVSFNKRKRKRLSQRIQLEGTPLGSGKRRSSVSDAGLLSVSNSLFDCTTSPDKLLDGDDKLLHHADPEPIDGTPVKRSMRFNHFMDFFTTESNYVGILDTILNLFKNKLEELAETNDPLLNKSEIKSVFGNFLPIHEVHQSMLEHLRNLHANWREDCLIGDIIIRHQEELIKAYPPYVNFYEQMKEQLQYCDREYPRFHAFLKINQTKPECGRQSLQDLMIRPVQRLPSISLLLKDILKHTANSNADHERLEEALKAIKQVTLHINEDKRRTESRMAIFDIFNDIDGCPAHLVSSNRSFIAKCEVNELSDSLSGRGDSLVLYLFSDSIELCKRRSRAFNTVKSPSTGKTHKHLKLISLNTIRFVIDILDSPRAFGLLLRGDKEKFYTFTMNDEETDKHSYMKKLCNQIAAHMCRTDADKLLLCQSSQELDVDISDVNVSTLSKAFKLAAKTRLKVGRAFSFNKTPNKLKRAVSTMMTSPFGSTNSLTPSSQLAQMRLAANSCRNINEVADEDDCSSMRSSSPSTQSETLVVPPMSVQPTRKNKAVVGRI